MSLRLWQRELLIHGFLSWPADGSTLSFFSQRTSQIIFAHNVAVGDIAVQRWPHGPEVWLWVWATVCVCVAPLINWQFVQEVILNLRQLSIAECRTSTIIHIIGLLLSDFKRWVDTRMDRGKGQQKQSERDLTSPPPSGHGLNWNTPKWQKESGIKDRVRQQHDLELPISVLTTQTQNQLLLAVRNSAWITNGGNC